MSAEANPPPDSAPPGDAKFADPLPQKRRHKKADAPDENAEVGEGEILVLSSLLQALLAKKQETSAAPGEPEARSRMNRLVKKNPPAVAHGLAEAEAGDAAPDEPLAREGVAAVPVSSALPKLKPRAYQEDAPGWGGSPGRGRGVLYFLFTAAVAIAAFLAGRADARRTAAKALPPPPAAVWTAGLLKRLDQMLAADQSGDILGAKRLAVDLQKQAGNSLPLGMYLASLDTRLGNTSGVEAELSKTLKSNPPPQVAHAINQAMAFNYDRARDFPHADETFAALTETDPFPATDFYQWGETLRRKGAMPDAIEKFRQALLRLPPNRPEFEGQRECAEFKIRLAQIELGHAADIQAAIEEHLHAPAPSGYWLLTAGAAALQRGDFPAAVDALQRARAALPPVTFGALTDDYTFHAYSYRADVAAIVPPEDPANRQKRMAGTGYFVDP